MCVLILFIYSWIVFCEKLCVIVLIININLIINNNYFVVVNIDL